MAFQFPILICTITWVFFSDKNIKPLEKIVSTNKVKKNLKRKTNNKYKYTLPNFSLSKTNIDIIHFTPTYFVVYCPV